MHSDSIRQVEHLRGRLTNLPGLPVLRRIGGSFFLVGLLTVGLIVAGCKKQPAAQTGDSDANGYLCAKCNAKLYTDRSVSLAPKCPKCQQPTLMLMGGYRCDKDQHLTIRPQRGDRFNVPVCEQCQSQLQVPMIYPRAADFQAWGATKFSP